MNSCSSKMLYRCPIITKLCTASLATSEMDIGIIIKYPMTVIKDNDNCRQGLWRNWRCHLLKVEISNGIESSENSLAVTQIVKHRVTIWHSHFILRYTSVIGGKKSICL